MFRLKFLITPLILMVSSCAHQSIQQQTEELFIHQKIYQDLSTEDKKIHACLNQNKRSQNETKFTDQNLTKSCLQLSAYENRNLRTPNQSTSELIEANQWVFENPEFINSIHEFIRELKHASSSLNHKLAQKRIDLINGFGVGFSASAGFGATASWAADLMYLDGKYGLFCTPALGFETDIELTASVQLTRALNCKTNADFAGEGLNITAGLSSEMFLLPFEGALSYGLGFDYTAYNKSIDRSFKSKNLNREILMAEIKMIQSLNPNFLSKYFNSNSVHSLSYYSLNFLIRFLSGAEKTPLPSEKMTTQLTQLLDTKSLGSSLKKFIESKSLNQLLLDLKLNELKKYLSILNQSIAGCDSIGGSASLSVSESPLSIGITKSNSTLLLELPTQNFNLLTLINPLFLMNPKLLNYNELTSIIQMARSLYQIKDKVVNHCGFNKL